MLADQSEKAEKLVAALGILARAQELGASEDDIWVLTAGVQRAEREFRADYRPFQQPGSSSARPTNCDSHGSGTFYRPGLAQGNFH